MLSEEIANHIRKKLSEHANPEDAAHMQRYLKTSMDFYGVKSPIHNEIVAGVKKLFPITNQEEYNLII